MEWADIFGYAGIFTGVSFMLPQVYRTYKTKSVEDISWGMLLLFLANCLVWIGYGILLPAFAALVTNAIALVVVLFQIVLKFAYRNNP